jgi:hypothetical protein
MQFGEERFRPGEDGTMAAAGQQDQVLVRNIWGTGFYN